VTKRQRNVFIVMVNLTDCDEVLGVFSSMKYAKLYIQLQLQKITAFNNYYILKKVVRCPK